jgi:hypothetical protein
VSNKTRAARARNTTVERVDDKKFILLYRRDLEERVSLPLGISPKVLPLKNGLIGNNMPLSHPARKRSGLLCRNRKSRKP